MSDKLQPVVPPVLSATNAPTTINLPGDGNTHIAQAERVEQRVNLFMMPGAQALNSGLLAGVQQSFNYDYGSTLLSCSKTMLRAIPQALLRCRLKSMT